MSNPFFGNAVSPNGATQPSRKINDGDKKYSRGFNKFDYSRPFYNTVRFAEVTPHEVIECWSNDRIPIFNRHEIRTHTLISPLMSDFTMKKSYFAVDYRSILPLNWSKILTNPVVGDDIPSGKYVGTWTYYFEHYLKLMKSSVDNIPNIGASDTAKLHYYQLYFLLFESIVSNGSLLSSLGCHYAPHVVKRNTVYRISFDQLVDNYFTYDNFKSFVSVGRENNWSVGFHVDSNIYGFGPGISSENQLTVGQVFDYLRHHTDVYLIDNGIDLLNFFKVFFLQFDFHVPTSHAPNVGNIFNYSRLCAYQLACAQFFTNDKIDYVYSAELWRENQASLLDHVVKEIPDYDDTFLMNGVTYKLDTLSGYNFYNVIKFLSSVYNSDGIYGSEVGTTSYSVFCAFQYLFNIFCYQRSLKFGDYFTGASANPLAVMNSTDANVGSSTSVLDLTRKLMVQRFVNAVNRAGSRLSDYVRDILNGTPAPDVTVPRFLCSDSSSVSGFEVENTAENQGNIVTLLKSSNSKYLYEVEVGEPCIIIGVTHFDVQRIYSKTVDKFFYQHDRFSMFNPFMQYIGDQRITKSELNSSLSESSTYAYTRRHMEYKQRYPIASGGFVEYLPGYAFITDNYKSGIVRNFSGNISPDFIRSDNSEMDRFYSSLTGVSLASRFHFIIKYFNGCDAIRQMEYSPSIL